MAAIVEAGRFTFRVAQEGDLLHNGLTQQADRERRDYEQGTIVEIYDARVDRSKFGPLGQFVSAYSAKTLATLPYGSQLDLHGGIPAWTMDPVETNLLAATAMIALAAE